MSAESKSSASAGIGFFGLLQVAFIVLKLCGVIAWSWWAVLIPTLVYIGIFIIGLLMVLLATVMHK